MSDKVGSLYTMDAGIRPLYEPMRQMVGTALTVKAVPGDNWAIHGALARATVNDVLVIDWHGYQDGCGSGALSLVAAMVDGLAGIVIDGAWRDIDEVKSLGLPIFGRGTHPFSPTKRFPGELNVPVCCGRVIVEAGDVVVGDADGVAVVPRHYAEFVAESLQPAEAFESLDHYPIETLALRRNERRALYDSHVAEARAAALEQS
ncbi:MAG: RraA family protein [Candidatus Nanopelagicales bacterium]